MPFGLVPPVRADVPFLVRGQDAALIKRQGREVIEPFIGDGLAHGAEVVL